MTAMAGFPRPCSRPAGKADGTVVVKIGGSLVTDRPRLTALLAECAQAPSIAVVPGGGPFADAVRTAQGALGFADGLAHRLALDAMGRMAEVFQALEPRLPRAASAEAVAAILEQGGSAIWDPVALKEGHPDIPASWDVTSDSLALWLAGRLGAPRCVLVKSALVPPEADAEALARAGLVDAAFPRFAAAYSGAIAIQGPDSSRERHAA